MENNKQTLLKAKNALYKTVDGVTYFKLKSEFDGDYTKNCGLLGEEIDENFYFLRGYDIESIHVDKDRNLVINRVDKDYEPIKVNIGEDLGKDSFKFDKESGTIIVTYPDGTTAKMEGFLVEGKDIRIATDSTIDGDGTIFNPLRISPVDKTGTFAPADDFLDLSGYKLIPKGKGKGHRIVTKETIDNFGCLYSLKEMQSLQKELIENKSQWRIPTKEDWDELLNAIETNPQARNHDSLSNKWLGEVAGSALKSVNLWQNYDLTSRDSYEVAGEDKVGLTIYPLGIGPDRNEILNDENADIEGFTKLSGMWTSTLDKTGNAYVKIFGYNSAQVDQDTYGDGARMSIRLVKDYSYSNYNEIEDDILGLPYPTELVYGICNDMPYVKIWTKINAYFFNENLGERSTEWDVVTDSDRGIKTVYFINEWDGNRWHKKLMNDGDSVVIKNYNEKPYHEWRIINGELVDTVKAIMDEFSDELSKINNRIDEEIENREKADAIIKGELDKEIQNRIDADAVIKGELDKEIQNRKDADAVIKGELDKEIKNRIDADAAIKRELENEIQNRKDADAVIEKNLADEIQNRKDAIEKEISERHAHDITPGEYILDGANDKEMILPTNGENIDDVKIKLSDDFFYFGKIVDE